MTEPFRQEIESLSDRFFGEGGLVLRTWTPRVDVEETDKEIVVKADVPGTILCRGSESVSHPVQQPRRK